MSTGRIAIIPKPMYHPIKVINFTMKEEFTWEYLMIIMSVNRATILCSHIRKTFNSII